MSLLVEPANKSACQRNEKETLSLGKDDCRRVGCSMQCVHLYDSPFLHDIGAVISTLHPFRAGMPELFPNDPLRNQPFVQVAHQPFVQIARVCDRHVEWAYCMVHLRFSGAPSRH